MKRFLLAVTAIVVLSLTQASAQARFGVTGGVNWNQSRLTDVVNEKPSAGWNAGVTLGVDLPLGFSIQPSLLYHQKNVLITDAAGQKMGYIELPVSVQWGPDLLIFRPFLDASPYIGYALSNELYADAPGLSLGFKDGSWEGKHRLEYGLGLGGGIEVWRLQFVVRYNWNFGQLYNVQEWNDIKEQLGGLKVDNKNFSGVTLGMSVFF